MVFITETKCVYYAVRTGTLNTIQSNLNLKKTNGYKIQSCVSGRDPEAGPVDIVMIFTKQLKLIDCVIVNRPWTLTLS